MPIEVRADDQQVLATTALAGNDPVSHINLPSPCPSLLRHGDQISITPLKKTLASGNTRPEETVDLGRCFHSWHHRPQGTRGV